MMRQIKKPSSDMAEDRGQFWLAAFRGVICATEGNCARFEAYFDMAGWWTYDVFMLPWILASLCLMSVELGDWRSSFLL